MSQITFLKGTPITKEWLNDVDQLRYGLGDATKGSSLLQFLQSGTGAVVDTVQGWARAIPPVNILDFCSATKRTAILAGTQTVVDAELDLAIATRRPIVWPKGSFELALAHTAVLGNSVEQDMVGAGAMDSFGTTITLTGAGRLEFTKAFITIRGFYITSAVSALTFVTLSAQGIKFHDFQLIGSGTSAAQFGIELATDQGASPGAVSWVDIDHFKIGAIKTAFKTTGTHYFNGNNIGSDSCNLNGFTTAFQIGNTGGCGINRWGGYCESTVNPSSLFKLAAVGATLSNDNLILAWKDSGGFSMDTINNSVGGTVGENVWLRITPDEWQESGTVARQIFVQKTLCRAYLTADQTNIADNTATKVAWDGETYDNSNSFSGGTFTAKRTLRLRVEATLDMGQNTIAGTGLTIILKKNSSEFSRTTAYSQGTSSQTVSISDTVDVVSGDTLDCYVIINRGTAVTHTVGGSTAISHITFTEL